MYVKIKKCIVVLIIIFFSMQCDYSESNEPQEWQKNFCNRLNEIGSGYLKQSLNKEFMGALEFQASAFDSKISTPAIFEIWLEESGNVEIYWWKHEDRSVRCFVMALYLCATDEPVSWVPDFKKYILRFNEKEMNLRSEELEFVLMHRSALAGLIAQCIRYRNINKYNSKYKYYFETVQEKSLGKPLPSWCGIKPSDNSFK